MKASTILLGAALGVVVCGVGSASGAPRAAVSSGANYMVSAQDLGGMHLGGFYRNQDRDIDFGTFEQEKAALHIGYDLLPWLSVYGLVGSTRVEFSTSAGESDAAFEWGGGASVNFLDHDVLGNLTMETRLRLQGVAQLSHSAPEVNGEDISCTELYSAVTLGLVSEVIGNKNYWPEAVGIFAGPVYDTVQSDDFDEDGANVGILVGLDLYITRYLTTSLSYEAYEENGAVGASLDLRF